MADDATPSWFCPLLFWGGKGRFWDWPFKAELGEGLKGEAPPLWSDGVQ